MGGKTKIVITAVISVAVTAVATANVVGGLYSRYGAFLPSSNEGTALSNKLKTIEYLMDKSYLYDYDKNALTEKAVGEYVEALDEPYTHYYTKEEFTAYMDNIEDGYMGIGVVISFTENDEIVVISTFDDSPAYKAGIKPGDIIKTVDDKEYKGSQMDEAVTAIKSGEVGTAVKLGIVRNGESMEFNVERSNIITKSVAYEMLDNGIGLVRISGFNTADEGSDRDTYTEFKEAVEDLQGQGMTGMIIDLRDNPGGELQVVCNIADMLLGEGTITYIEYKDGTKDTYSSDAEALNIPMTVLINGNSASASEVLTGALKDYGAATVIGEKSYGKGIVQNVFPFADGSGMSMTVAKYYSPNGVCIHGIGIEPDIEVALPEKYSGEYAATVPHEEDTQLQKAIETLRNGK